MIQLDFPYQKQESPNSCWAAVVSSIALFYNVASPWTQKRLLQDACGTEFNGLWLADEALKRTGNLAQKLDRPLTWNELSFELSASRVVAARIQFSFGPGHLVALVGFSDDQNVEIADPEHGLGSCKFVELLGSYCGFGMWTHTYLTTSGSPSPTS